MTAQTDPITTPAARLHSINSAPAHTKIIHLIRHAQGTHNVSNDLKSQEHLDAQLTPHGIEQCRLFLEKYTGELGVECIISSPMTRALQTAKFCFDGVTQPEGNTPLIACEEWRETVNYFCDVRRETHALRDDFPHVDFQHLQHNEDPIWAMYEAKFGDHMAHDAHRESADREGLERRARAAWKFVAKRPEKSIAIVSHTSFFRHMFAPNFDGLEGIVKHEDDNVRKLMTSSRFENCEVRSVAFEVP